MSGLESTSDISTSGAGPDHELSLGQALVYLVDDDPAVVRATTFLLETHGANVRAFTCPMEFLESAKLFRGPACVLLDMTMPQMSGLSVQQQLAKVAPHMAVVIMTGLASYANCADAMRLGAVDILEKPVHGNQFVMQVSRYLDAAMTRWEDCQDKFDFQRCHNTLTGREREVFSLLLEGHQTKQLAYKLTISVSTAEKHVRNVLKKFAVNSTVRLILASVRHGGLVSPTSGETAT